MKHWTDPFGFPFGCLIFQGKLKGKLKGGKPKGSFRIYRETKGVIPYISI